MCFRDNHAQNWVSTTYSVTVQPVTELLNQCQDILAFESPSAHVLDIGAGNGMPISLLKLRNDLLPVVAADISSGMIQAINERAREQGWKNFKSKVLDVQDMASVDDRFSHVISTFVLNFVADPHVAVREMVRLTRAGGVIGLACWGPVKWSELWETAVGELRPGYHSPDVFHPDTTNNAGVEFLLKQAGCTDVAVKTIYVSEPNQTSEQAVAFTFESDNPTLLRLRSGFNEDFLAKLKPVFKEVYAKETQNGSRKTSVPAVIATARKPL